MTTRTEVIDILNDLLKNAHDGHQGYLAAAKETHSPYLQNTFQTLAEHHARTAADLAALVQQHGGEAVDHGSATGAVHRGWLKVKAAVGADSDASILDEAERGEDANVARYRKALKADSLPADLLATIDRQAQAAQRSHDEIKAMRDAAKAKA